MSKNLNKIAPAAKKAPAKTAATAAVKPRAAKAPRVAKPKATAPAKKRAAAPRAALSQKLLLAREEARAKREKERAAVKAERLVQKEKERKEKLALREEKKNAREAAKALELLAREERKAAKKLARSLGRPGLPTIKKDMELEDTELLKPLTERPFTGRDVDALCKSFDLNASEFASALGLQNRFAFSKLLRSTRVVPFDVEMLCRLYEESPSPAPWRSYEADQVFKLMYGGLIDEFVAGGGERAHGEMLFSKRFTSALDRSSSTAYRWMETEGGGSRLVIELLLRKVMSVENPRLTLERLSTLVHKVRGGDFEKRAPTPDPTAPRSLRGRTPGSARTGARRGAVMPLAIRPLTL